LRKGAGAPAADTRLRPGAEELVHFALQPVELVEQAAVAVCQVREH
jgi:hypothetical protein